MMKIRYIFHFLIRMYYPLLISLCFLIFLLGIRILVTGSFFYTFLVWNLFLAILPYLLTQFALLNSAREVKNYTKLLVFFVWLMLLPNAPYLITDIIHLHNQNSDWVWFDLFLVFAFACNGLFLYLLSLADMTQLLTTTFSKKLIDLLVVLISLLSGYGIYLGRFLRFNSWDVLLKPGSLFSAILDSFFYPYTYLMTLAFGLFLWMSFLIFRWTKR